MLSVIPNCPICMELRPTPSDEVDLHELLFKFRSRWPLFVAALLIAGAAAWFYLQVKAPVYAFQSTMLVGNRSTGSKQAQELLQLLDSKEKVVKLEDEIGILTSTDMLRRTLAQLPFEVSYYAVPDTWLNTFRDVQRREQPADAVPFQVVPAPGQPQLTGVPINVDVLPDGKYRVHAEVSKGQVRLLASGELVREVLNAKLDQTVAAGDTLRDPLLTAVVVSAAAGGPATSEGRYYVQLNDLSSLAGDYQGRLKVKATDHESRILELSIQGNVPEKEQKFLNTLMNLYIQDDLSQKNQTGNRTLAFLDDEIGKLSQSRQRSAEAVSSFRSSQSLVDAGAQSGVGIQQQTELESMRARIANNQKTYQNTLSYLLANRKPSQMVALSSAGIEDPSVTNLISRLTELNGRRATLAVAATGINPLLVELDEQITATKESLIQTLRNLSRTSEISLRSLNQQLSTVKSQINRMPENERRLSALTSRSDFNEKNYAFLVEKRNEAAIALATNTADKKIIDQARMTSNGPAAPKAPLVALIALLVALALPAGFVLLTDKANRRIQSKEDLSRITNIPLLGVIPHGSSKDKQTMLQDHRGPIAEAFRSIRVNLQYLSAGLDKRIIGITSSVPGEGKSFCSVNLAAELAHGGRRVVLLECDMRRPTVAGYFGIDTHLPHGLSTYLAGQSTLAESRITTAIPNLDVVCCGPIPQNPTQLVESPQLDRLLQQLREEYDYVLIDIPPMGYVSEFLVLLHHLDASIYVVRQNYTDRNLVGQIDELHRTHKVKQLYTVINDMHFEKTYEYRYKTKAYSYGS